MDDIMLEGDFALPSDPTATGSTTKAVFNSSEGVPVDQRPADASALPKAAPAAAPSAPTGKAAAVEEDDDDDDEDEAEDTEKPTEAGPAPAPKPTGPAVPKFTSDAPTSVGPGAPTAPAPAAPASAAPSSLRAMVREEAQKGGVSADYMERMAQIESSWNPAAKARTSSASGLYQFIDDTWKSYGNGGDRFDPRANTQAAVRLTLDNQKKLTQALGRAPEDWELYLAHQQGAGGAIAILKNPGARAIDALTPIYRGGSATATSAIINNGGNAGMSAGEFAGLWKAKYAGVKPGGKGGDAPIRATGPSLFSDDQMYGAYRSDSAQPRDYSYGEAITAAMKHHTVLGLITERLNVPGFKPDADFKWTPDTAKAYIADLPKAEGEYIRNTAVSESHADFLRSKALDRIEGDNAIADQGMLGGLGVMLGTGLVDLPGMLAGGVAGRALLAGRSLSAIARVGAMGGVGAASAVPLEATKLALNPSYTAGDAAEGLAMGALFVGGLSSLGALGKHATVKYREAASGAVERVTAYEAGMAAKSAAGADVADGAYDLIKPTAFDKVAAKISKFADFSVGGKLYWSNNDAISELAPKLTTVATQTLTKGGRLEEGAIDFVQRQVQGMNSRVEGALRIHYNNWADDAGLNAAERWTGDHLQTFYEQAARLHTDPAMVGAKASKHVEGFVGEMRKGFADMLETAKAYGLPQATKIDADDFYLPRYPSKDKWVAFREEHGIEELENLVNRSIRDAQPNLAAKIGQRVVERAAGREVKLPEAERLAAKATKEADIKIGSDKVRADANQKLNQAKTDEASGLTALDDAKAGKADQLTLEGLKRSGDEEVKRWEDVAAAMKSQADEVLKKPAPSAAEKEINKRQHAALMKEHEETLKFAQEIRGHMAESFAVALSKQLGRPLTAAELTAIRNYTGSGYGIMNDHLRKNKGALPSQATQPVLYQQVADLDAGVLTSVTDAKTPTTLWRGVKLDGDSSFEAMGKLKVGDTFTEDAFLSTSKAKDVAENFVAGSSRKAIFEIETPKGALYGDGKVGQHAGEKELIFPRGARLVISERVEDASGMIRYKARLETQMAGEVAAVGGPIESKITAGGEKTIKSGLKNQRTDAEGKIRAEREAELKRVKAEAAEAEKTVLQAIRGREFQRLFDEKMAVYEDRFYAKMSRTYVKHMDDSVMGIHADVDGTLSMKDTDRLRDALLQRGVVMDADMAEAMADMLAPRAQRGPANLRYRTQLNENLEYAPARKKNPMTGEEIGEAKSYSLRDLMETDYHKITDRYTRSVAPAIIMHEKGFGSEAAARRYVSEVTRQNVGQGYTERNARMDERRAGFMLDAIYGRDSGDAGVMMKAIGQTLRNVNTVRLGGSFGMAQTYDTVNLLLRYGHETMRKVAPSFDEAVQVLKRGGPEADAMIRDMQIWSGLAVKGQEGRVMKPVFQGLDRALAEDLGGGMAVKALRLSRAGANMTAHLSGLNFLTDLQHMVAARGWLQTAFEASRGMREFDPRMMAHMGLSPSNLQKFGKLLDHVKVNKQGVIEDLNVEVLRQLDAKTFDQMMGLMRRDAQTAILEPHAGLKPMWMSSTEFGKFAGQLKSFAMASHAVHTLGNLNLGPAYAATALVGGAAWASALYFMWTHVRSAGRPDREEYLEKYLSLENPGKLASAIWDRSGVSGITPMVLGSMIEGAEMIGIKEKDEGFNSNARASGLSQSMIKGIPTVDLVDNIAQALSYGVNTLKGEAMTQKEFGKVRKLIPVQNAIGIGNVLNLYQGTLPESR